MVGSGCSQKAAERAAPNDRSELGEQSPQGRQLAAGRKAPAVDSENDAPPKRKTRREGGFSKESSW